MTIAEKIRRYCEYQDRSEWEVRKKMAQLLLPQSERETLMLELRAERYVDDERFAENFVRGKMNQKRWGRTRIAYELQLRGVASSIVAEKISELDDEKYYQNLQYLVARWHDDHPDEEKVKLFQYLLRKGYKTVEINKVIQ